MKVRDMLHAAAAGDGDGTDAVADGGVGATRLLLLLRVKNRTMSRNSCLRVRESGDVFLST